MHHTPSLDLELPLSVELKLTKLCARHGQQVDRIARHELGRAGEQMSTQALDKIEKSNNRIQSLSKYIVCMIRRGEDVASLALQGIEGSPTRLLSGRHELFSPSTHNTSSKSPPVNQTKISTYFKQSPKKTCSETPPQLDDLLNEPIMYDDDFFKDLAAQEEKLQSPLKNVQKEATACQAGQDVVHNLGGFSIGATNNPSIALGLMSDPSTPESRDINPIDVKQTCKRSLDSSEISVKDTSFGHVAKFLEPFEDIIRVYEENTAYPRDEDLLTAIPLGQMCYKEKKTGCSKRIPLPYLKALSELSQVRALLVLSCFSEGGWSEVLSLEDIIRCKDACLEEVEGRLKQAYAMYKNSSRNLTVKRDWSKLADQHIVFHCDISRTGGLVFKGPFFEQTGCPLQTVFGDGGVLRVHFADIEGDFEAEGHYRRIAREGLWVGLRQYEFYGFKDPKVKKKDGLTKDITSTPRCIFICTKSHAKADIDNLTFRHFKNIDEARNYMMHINTVPTLSKKFARLQLALSQTLPVLNLDDPNIKVEMIEDIRCTDAIGNIVVDSNGEPLIHTDGTGYVSADIAARCPAHVFKGRKQNSFNEQEYPLLMQVRIFYRGSVSKGTLLVNLKLPTLTIQIRPSMLKVKTDDTIRGSSFNSLELCNTSRRPSTAKLFQHLSLLLINGGVPESVLLNYAKEALEDIKCTIRDRGAAMADISKSMEQGEVRRTVLSMLGSGIPLNDAYLQKTMWDTCKPRLEGLSKARIAIPETFHLMGCADPSGRLERTQVAIVLENGPIYHTKVLVYKSPGLHPGDIHVFEATWYKEIEEFIGDGKYGIFFSIKGPRSIVDEIANSDLDGDQYWVCLNPQLVKHFKPSPVWEKPFKNKVSVQPKPLSSEELDKKQFESFLAARFHPSYTMGIAANSWLAHMDWYLTLQESNSDERRHLQCVLQRLVDTYYDAVDAEKSGEQVTVNNDDKATLWPHYMKKMQKKKWIIQEHSYQSRTFLGQIYDIVKRECHSDDFSWEPEGEIFIEQKFEYPGYHIYYNQWGSYFKDYKCEVRASLQDTHLDERNTIIDALLQKYRRELYKADTLIASPEPLEEVYKQASAIYCQVYHSAQKKLESMNSDVPVQQKQYFGLQFAWRVAGVALCQMYIRKSGEEPMLFSPTVISNVRFVKRDTMSLV